MESRTVGIKIVGDSIAAQGIKVVRNSFPLAISEIKSRVQNGEYLYECDYIDPKGIKQIIRLFTELKKLGIGCELYEHNRLTTIEFLRNLTHTYAEISKETERIMDLESDDS